MSDESPATGSAARPFTIGAHDASEVAQIERDEPELPPVIDGVDWQSAAVALTFLTCPWRNRIGICHAGCRDEPECETCEPEGGWAQQLREAISE